MISFSHVVGKLSMGREEAYELFKRDFDKDNKIEEAKAELRDRCSAAKKIGQQMIESRNASSESFRYYNNFYRLIPLLSDNVQ